VQLSWVTTSGDEQLGQVWGINGIGGAPGDILANIFGFVNIFGLLQNILVLRLFILFYGFCAVFLLKLGFYTPKWASTQERPTVNNDL